MPSESKAKKAVGPKTPRPSSSRIPPVLETPFRGMHSANSQGSEHGYPTVKVQTVDIDTEFANCSNEDHDLAARAFRKIASKRKIDKFIDKCNLYDNERKQWKIPQDTSLHENVLYQPYIDICNQVIAHFGLSEKRVAINIHKKSMSHREGSGPKYPLPNDAQDHGSGSQIPDLSTAPDICFQALVSDEKAADNFPYAVPGAEPTYRMTLTPFELKTASTFSAKGNLKQIAVYARYVNSSVYFSPNFVCIHTYIDKSSDSKEIAILLTFLLAPQAKSDSTHLPETACTTPLR